MSRSSTAGIIISKFGESLLPLRKQRQQPISNPDLPAGSVTVTGVCYSDAGPNLNPNPNPLTSSSSSSTYPPLPPTRATRTPNEVAPFEEPTEPTPLATAIINAAAARPPRQPQSSRPVLKKLISTWSTDEYPQYPPVPRSATSSNFSYPSYTYDDTASFDSHQSRHIPARFTSSIMDIYRQPGLPAPPPLPPRRVDSIGSTSTTNDFLPQVPSSASAALRMLARSTYHRDRSSERTGSGSSFYTEQGSTASTEAESRNDYSLGKTSFPRFSGPSRRTSTGQYGTPHPPSISSSSRFSVVTTHSDSSIPQLESFTPTFGMKKLPSLPAASVRSFDEFSFPSPPSTPLPGSVYSEDAYDSDGITIPDLHTQQPQLAL
jgi:hypothetical protein